MLSTWRVRELAVVVACLCALSLLATYSLSPATRPAPSDRLLQLLLQIENEQLATSISLEELLVNESTQTEWGLCTWLRRVGVARLLLAPCWSLPEEARSLVSVAAASPSARWLLPGTRTAVASSQVAGTLRNWRAAGVAREILPSALRVAGLAANVRVLVLVPSLCPLRVYAHDYVLIVLRHVHSQGGGEWWPGRRLWSTIGSSANTDAVLAALFIAVEPFLLAALATTDHRCERWRRLLSVELVYPWKDAAPRVWEVSPAEPQSWRRDASALLQPGASVAVHLARALQRAANNTGVSDVDCMISHELCLTPQDLESLLQWHRELTAVSDFRLIYPRSGNDITQLVHNVHHYMLRDPDNYFHAANAMLRNVGRHSTADLHDLAVSLLSLHNHRVVSLQPDTAHVYLNCSQDEAAAGLLSWLRVEPSLLLRPHFSPLVRRYLAVVSYQQTTVRVLAGAAHCSSTVRLPSASVTLGVGENRVLVVVERDSQPLSRYTLVLARQPASIGEPGLKDNFSACALRQECEYRFSPQEPCGLLEDGTWSELTATTSQLPICSHGDATGQWSVPCEQCGDRKSCVWSSARWQPEFCQHALVSRSSLERCLAGSKVLFVGDSTNRGMLHYVLERLNGTLSECDKTHNMRVYEGLNGGATTLSFAYYPQFWLEPDKRPKFNATLIQLINRSRPLENSSSTVVVVGGVHWLAPPHLHQLQTVLRTEALTAARVIVKTLGAGFHVPADGVHRLPQGSQERLLRQSLALAAYARRHGMDVVDTFNITAARFNDFLQGKCACHFHKLEQLPGSAGYHVTGHVNAVYSEILLSRLCHQFQ